MEGLHSFEDLTKHIKTRIDDSHAPPEESLDVAYRNLERLSGREANERLRGENKRQRNITC